MNEIQLKEKNGKFKRKRNKMISISNDSNYLLEYCSKNSILIVYQLPVMKKLFEIPEKLHFQSADFSYNSKYIIYICHKKRSNFIDFEEKRFELLIYSIDKREFVGCSSFKKRKLFSNF